MPKEPGRYVRIIEAVFQAKFKPGQDRVPFTRDDLVDVCAPLKIKVPKNVGDIVYSFRYRADWPESIKAAAPEGRHWIIMAAGDALYQFEAVNRPFLLPNDQAAVAKVPDSTPGIIAANAKSDEQALLARLRYNRLVDTFLRVTCHSLQNHLRTKVAGLGQIEVDELYLGVDRNGAQYVVPVQAKGKKDKHSAVQIRQDIELCRTAFPGFVCRPVGAQFLRDGRIALMEFRFEDGEVVIVNERHFRLVGPDGVSDEDLAAYRATSETDA